MPRDSYEILTPPDMARLDFAKGGGLIPAIVQHAGTGAVLMLGYMSADALRATLERRRVVFYSRSKQRLWEKGETSGNVLTVERVWGDCDADTLLIAAWPHGAVCHTGMRTCFGDESVTASERLAFLETLERIIEQRIAGRPEGSYTARLFSQGPKRIAQKVGEEGLEVALAAVGETDEKVVAESADLLFHLLVLLRSRHIPLSRIVAELQARHAARS